jgi:hypothetical protein
MSKPEPEITQWERLPPLLDTHCFFSVVFFSAIDDCMGLNANITIKSEIIVNAKYILIKIISYDGTGCVQLEIISGGPEYFTSFANIFVCRDRTCSDVRTVYNGEFYTDFTE